MIILPRYCIVSGFLITVVVQPFGQAGLFLNVLYLAGRVGFLNGHGHFISFNRHL